MKIWGVDFGSKLAGTTVIAYCNLDDYDVKMFSSEKKRDADEFLISQFERLQPDYIFLDAPLSLPGVYRELKGYDNYMFRQCDRQIGAMSPMFLGGLTARAMRLKQHFQNAQSPVLEVYPGGLVKTIFEEKEGYKKAGGLEEWNEKLTSYSYLPDLPKAENWHQFDALLALHCGIRYLQNKCEVYGVEDEGLIYV